MPLVATNITHPVHTLQQILFSERYAHLWTPRVTVLRNEFLVRVGEKCPLLYFVESGALRVIYETEEEDFTIRFGYRDSFISVLPSLLRNVPAQYSIQALKASNVVALHRNHLLKAVAEDPELAALWNMAQEQLILEQLEREIDILTPQPAERYARVLARSPRLFQEIPNKYIASYLRMKPETLSRLKKG